jgi:hypothetical protein
MVVGAVLVALAVVMTAGTLVASNMGFKLNYALDQPGGIAKTGNNVLALPDNRQTGLNTARNLMDDIGFASVTNISRFIAATDTYLTYTGRAPNPSSSNFSLTAGEAYLVKMKTGVNYIVVGSDDPALSYTLSQPGGAAKTGNNFYAFNYHQTAATAKQLMDDIGFTSVTNVSRFLRASDTYLTYTGRAPNPSSSNFTLTPGEGYLIKMKTTAVYTPSHY